jgi:Tn3 transposase DDE domain
VLPFCKGRGRVVLISSGDSDTASFVKSRSHKIASQWGEGLFVSSDMMSLEATRHLWSARLDPRRQTHAVGTYTHVLDQWPIIYDQPIVLNRRQAGAAIEGAMRQRHVELEKLAVDTHGFTHFAMAMAKLLGFDLCPRLADLGDRKLFVPRGIEIPDALVLITERLTLGNTVRRGWDSLVRIAASINDGWCSATTVMLPLGMRRRYRVLSMRSMLPLNCEIAAWNEKRRRRAAVELRIWLRTWPERWSGGGDGKGDGNPRRRVRSPIRTLRSRCWRFTSSSAGVGTRTTRQMRVSPRSNASSMRISSSRSRRSVLTRLARRSTGMLAASITRFSTPAAVSARCSQKPS